MKFFMMALALCVWGLSAHCQFVANVGTSESSLTNSSPVVVNNVQRVAYKIAYPPGYRTRNTGRVMTIVGVPLFIGGIIVLNNVDENYYTVSSSSGYYDEVAVSPAAALMVVSGVGLTIPGVILWTKGAKKYKRHMEREAAFNFNGRGLSLSYRF